MKLNEKDFTLKQREYLSLLFWCAIIMIVGALFILQVNKLCGLTVLPMIAILAVIVLLEMDNNKSMGLLIKEKRAKEKETIKDEK